MCGFRLVTALACLAASALLAQTPLDSAAAAYQEGRMAEAEQILREVLKNHPNEPLALAMLGAVLDSGERYDEAEQYYVRALGIAPVSAQVFNNAGNHYFARGNRPRARELYLAAIHVDPNHVNANLQLAQLSLEDKDGRKAIQYLNRVRGDAAADAGALLLRARALALSGSCTESSRILNQLKNAPDARTASVRLATGLAQAECKSYAAAEESFSAALAEAPGNFEILYNLGLAAWRAGHADRAQSVLVKALHEQRDPDAIHALAQFYREHGQPVNAAALLAKAEDLMPQHPELARLLAEVSAELGFYDDAAAAYTRYLKSKPEDDTARRERGFNLARVNQAKDALRDLEWYAAKHPEDATGYFELAVAQIADDRQKAFALLNKALKIDPVFPQALYTRAMLEIEDENAPAAINDLKLYVEKEPSDFRALAQLGRAYIDAQKLNDALETLQRANKIAPDSSLVLLYYRRVLQKLGRNQEAAAVMARLRDAGNREDNNKRRVGLVDYLSLSPSDQRARYLSNLQRDSEADPGNARLRLNLARELIAEGKQNEGLEVLRQLAATDLEAALLADCGKILLDAGQFAEAHAVLSRAMPKLAARSSLILDLAIASFQSGDAEAALRELDHTAEPERQGDYYLLRAQILDAQGKVQEAAAALNLGIRAAPQKPLIYYQTTSFLLKHKLYHEALALLEQASRVLPGDRDLLLAQAVTLDLLRRNVDSEKLLAQIQSRWPEWERPYLLKGIQLEIALNSAEARQTLETAIALGANTPEAFYYEAQAILHSAPDDLEPAQNAIARALALTSKDPYIYLLAGKIALERKDYASAVDKLSQSIRLEPALVPAHYALRDAYRALGDEEKSREELETIKRIGAQTAGEGSNPFSVGDFLFTVRPPG